MHIEANRATQVGKIDDFIKFTGVQPHELFDTVFTGDKHEEHASNLIAVYNKETDGDVTSTEAVPEWFVCEYLLEELGIEQTVSRFAEEQPDVYVTCPSSFGNMTVVTVDPEQMPANKGTQG